MCTPISQTCLSKGSGYYFPPCHIMDISGVWVLFDCPMDLSSVTIFSPRPLDSNAPVNDDNISCSCQKFVDVESNEEKRGNGLIYAEPRYKTVKNLLSWNISFIDVVLISSPMGLLGLPFLTRNNDFSAKVYATEAASRIGQLMMEDLVYMHKEFRQFYGPEAGAPAWMKWDNLELLPLELKKTVFGTDGTEFSCWMPLYRSTAAMSFDYGALQHSDVVVYSDFSSQNALEQVDSDKDCSGLADHFWNSSSADINSDPRSALLGVDDYSEELDKLDFICSCSMGSIKAGGSVLIPTGRLGIILQLLERLELNLDSENMQVPIFVISSVAEELMAFTSIIPEWLCEEWQNRLYSGQPLFTHMEMLKEGRLRLFPAIHSVELLKIWQEPCVVICPHWSLRLGPVTHLLRRWRGDQNSLLVMEEGVDASLALLPFKPIAMKVLQCTFLSGIQLNKSLLLLKILQPKHVLFPAIYRRHVGTLETSFSSILYHENETISIPYTKGKSRLDIDIDLASQLKYTTLEEENIDIARLKGKLMVEQTRYKLCVEHNPTLTQTGRPVLYFGKINLNALVLELQKMGMETSVDKKGDDGGSCNASSFIHVLKPSTAVVEVTVAQTLIDAADENVAFSISKAVRSLLLCV